jgi:hypothetical protein
MPTPHAGGQGSAPLLDGRLRHRRRVRGRRPLLLLLRCCGLAGVSIGTDSATEIPLHFDSFLLCLLCVVGGGVYMACQRSELWR